MIYEIRTYGLKPRSLPEFEKRVAEKIPRRLTHSRLAGFWHTEIGPLNQVVHIWPYDDLNQRSKIRAEAVAAGDWPPDTAEFILDMESEIYLPAPFMTAPSERKIGPVYEMRIYTYPIGAIPKVLEAWSQAIPERVKLSPLAGCWYSDIGGLNKWVHMWAYRSLEERQRVRDEARQTGVWPPKSGVTPITQENKILLPASFSPMQ